MSPSPISSPLNTSGSSTPISGGNGAIPFRHINQSVYLQEARTVPNSPYMNGSSYWDPDVLRGSPSGSHAFRELASVEYDALGKQFGRLATGELCNGQSALANRVSQQLLRDHVKLISSVDLNPCPPLGGRTGGT
uniref:ATP binding protein n=2 Tax=Solanum TaxID=4107 RepID=M1CXM8_SOLTU